MKRKIIALATCLVLAASSLSAKSLVLTLANGKLVYYLLGGDSNPVMRFIDGGIVVNADRYEFSNVKNFYISSTDDPSGIEHTVGEDIQYDHNVIIVDCGNSPIGIYACDGRRVDVGMQQTNDKMRIDLSPLPQGIYIVTIGDTSLKICKK